MRTHAGTPGVRSSAYLGNKCRSGQTGLTSFTIIENNIGPRAVPCGTPLLCDINLLQIIACGTLPKALLKS